MYSCIHACRCSYRCYPRTWTGTSLHAWNEILVLFNCVLVKCSLISLSSLFGKNIKQMGGEDNIKAVSLWGRIYRIKRERGNKIIFPIILWLLGRMSSGRGKGHGNFREKDQDFKTMGVGKNIKLLLTNAPLRRTHWRVRWVVYWTWTSHLHY